MNIADVIEEHARQRPAAPALLSEDATQTYAELQAAVQGTAAVLAGQGLRAADVVGVSIDRNSALLFVTLLALARLGAVALPVHPTSRPEKRKAIARHFKLVAVVANREALGAEGVRRVHADASWLRPGATAALPTSAGGEDPWCITLTSGTTGTPKGILRSHAGFLRLSALQRSEARLGPDSRFLCRMDAHNTAVLVRGLNHFAAGGAVVLADSSLQAAFEAVDQHHVTDMFASPIMMTEWVRHLAPGACRFKTPMRLVIGGGHVPTGLAAAIAERITPNLCLSYGTTETGIVALADAATTRQHPTTAGRLVPWIDAEIVDADDRPLPPGQRGLLRFRGEGVADRYYAMPPAASPGAKGFRGGWFYPGDVGYISAERLLFIEERVDDIVNLGGPKLNARAAEEILARHPDVDEAAVFAAELPGGKTGIVAAVVARGALSSKALLQHYAEQGGRFSTLLRIVQVKNLPRNAAGKVVKQELKRRLRFKPAA